MDSLQILETKVSIRNYLNGIDMPAEVKRMILNELLAEVSASVNAEVRFQLAKREEEVKNVQEKQCD